MKPDLIDTLIDEWAAECPDLNTSGMVIVGRIMRLGHLMSQTAAKALKQHHLAYTDFDILATLRRQGQPYALTPTELRKAVLLTSGAMTTALDRLEKAGLIRRRPSNADRRSLLVSLTKEGEALATVAAKDRFEDAVSWIEKLSPNQQRRLSNLLKILGNGIDT